MLHISDFADVEIPVMENQEEMMQGWKDEVQRRLGQESDFLAELRARKDGRQPNSHHSSRVHSDSEVEQ